MQNMEEQPENEFFEFGDLICEVSESQYDDTVSCYLVIKLLKSGESLFTVYQKDPKGNPLMIQSVVGLLEMTKAQVLDDYLNQLYGADFNDIDPDRES